METYATLNSSSFKDPCLFLQAFKAFISFQSKGFQGPAGTLLATNVNILLEDEKKKKIYIYIYIYIHIYIYI